MQDKTRWRLKGTSPLGMLTSALLLVVVGVYMSVGVIHSDLEVSQRIGGLALVFAFCFGGAFLLVHASRPNSRYLEIDESGITIKEIFSRDHFAWKDISDIILQVHSTGHGKIEHVTLLLVNPPPASGLIRRLHNCDLALTLCDKITAAEQFPLIKEAWLRHR